MNSPVISGKTRPRSSARRSMAESPQDFVARPDRLAPSPTARRFELGNFNLPAIHAPGASLDMIEQIGVKNIQNHCFDLGDHIIAQLDELDLSLVGPRQRQHRSPPIYVVGLPATEWLSYFAENGVRVSPERDGIRVSFGISTRSTMWIVWCISSVDATAWHRRRPDRRTSPSNCIASLQRRHACAPNRQPSHLPHAHAARQ